MSKNFANELLTPKDVQRRFEEKGLPPNFCPVPFSTLIAQADGTVAICRQKSPDFVVGNLKDQTIEEIWNSPFLQNWRKEFITGNVKICEKEIRNENCNLCTLNNQLLDEIEISEIQTTPLKKLGANFNGRCNLKCKMCKVWLMPNGLYDAFGFWEKAGKNLFPFLEEVDLFSGEPFIQSDTFRLIDKVSKVAPDCHWTFTTNAFWKFDSKIKSYLDKIYVKNIILSIDSFIPETYANIRLGGDLKVVLKTVSDLQEYNKERLEAGKSNLGLTINQVYQKDNWKEVKSSFEWADEHNINISFRVLEKPAIYSVLNMSASERKEIVDFYFDTLTSLQLMRSTRIIKALANSLDPSEHKLVLKKMFMKFSKV